jgi:hypothetical protein
VVIKSVTAQTSCWLDCHTTNNTYQKNSKRESNKQQVAFITSNKSFTKNGHKSRATFEIDYKAKVTTKSFLAKYPEVKQAAEENVNYYFSKTKKIMWEQKSNGDPTAIYIPLVIFPAVMAAQWRNLDQQFNSKIKESS